MLQSNILRAWYLYAKECVPNNWTVTYAKQTDDSPRPPKPYLTLNIIAGPRPLTMDDELRYIDDDEFGSLVGQRSHTLSIQAYGDGFNDILSKIQSFLDDPDKRDLLREADIAVTSKGAITDISRALSTGYEHRASLDIVFNSSNNLLTGIGPIEKVEITGALDTGNSTIETSHIINKE